MNFFSSGHGTFIPEKPQPGVGITGLVESKTSLVTNFYPITIEENLQLWRYQVTVFEHAGEKWREISRGARDE